MRASDINKKGKKEKGQKVKGGECIFPFKYQWKEHNECFETEKGDICATSVSDRGTLKTYGYCEKPKSKSPLKITARSKSKSKSKDSLKKGTEKKALKKTLKKKKKLVIVDKFSPSKSKSKKSPLKEEKLKSKSPIKIEETIEMDLKPSPKGKPMNKELIDIMEELADIMMRQGEPFKARAYKKASETIMAHPGDITDVNELKNKPGIGKTIMDKLEEFQKTGTLRVLERERKNPMNLFTKIYGVGPKKAKQLIEDGITTIDQLKENEGKLNDTQKIGLKYYEPLQKRIPRDEIKDFEKVFDKVFKEVAPQGSKYEIVGSYRREAKNSGDIDVIITNEQNNIAAFNNFLDELIKQKVVIEVLTRGKTKSLTIGEIKDSIPRRIDFLYTAPDEYAFATLYFTGSKAFNTVMRQRALDMGYTLNEHGLSVMKSGKKGEKVDIDFPTEMSIFEFLGMKYKEPKQREGYKSVELLDKKKEETKEEDDDKVEKTPSKESSPKKVSNNKTIKVKKYKTGFKEHISDFKKNGIDTLKILTEKQLETMLDEAQKAYYNDPENSLLTDNEYDIIKEYMEKKYPKNKVLDQIGAPIQDKNKVKLPYFMASMDKIKPDTNALQKWKDKYSGPYVLSAKLDGISGLYSTENNEQKLYTRGNGEVGQDISHLIPFLKLPTTPDITIRGELIMKKSTFIDKYKDQFSNSRNLVSGLVNQKKMEPEKFKDVDFVAYEVIKPSLKPSEQMKFLEDEEVYEVINETKKNIDNSILSEILVDWRENYEYTIDGVIVENDEIYKRTEENPKHAFAFKMVLSDQIAEAKVLNVLWAPSKDGYLKPRIQIEPVVLGGAKIEYATAFNAAFVEDNQIGIGALVKLVRSGDVIPHIMEVIEPAEKAKMPDVDYKWNETHVDIILEDAEQDETVKEKNIVGFFKGLEVDGLGPGNVKKIIKAGYESVPQIIAMTEEDFLKVEGFKKKMAEKVFKSIHDKIDKASLPKIMAVSNIFGRGFGEKRIEPILSKYSDILTSSESDEEKIDKIKGIKGIEKKTAERFVNNISKFMDFIEVAKLQNKLSDIPIQEPKDESHPLYDKTIIITGFRDKELSEKLKDIGAKESSSVTKNTFAVIVKNKDEETGKTEAAKEKNIPLYTVEEFKEKYDLQ
ncbi:MAG: helix-hairpin-helix domain-containing protein [Promethearchaeota archaeon]|jgi:NAD-dependent DNA ligase/predicted flap endonuclease-1-like 5' DNA nuclease